MSRSVCGICFCPYGDEGDCACPTEQPAQQEPVAWRVWRGDAYELFFSKYAADRRADCFTKRPDVEPLYTSPPAQRKPLTDEQLRVIENKINPTMRWRSSDEEGITLYPIEYYELVRAIEAAHGIKEKNT